MRKQVIKSNLKKSSVVKKILKFQHLRKIHETCFHKKEEKNKSPQKEPMSWKFK